MFKYKYKYKYKLKKKKKVLILQNFLFYNNKLLDSDSQLLYKCVDLINIKAVGLRALYVDIIELNLQSN